MLIRLKATRTFFTLGRAAIAVAMCLAAAPAQAQTTTPDIVRVSNLNIDFVRAAIGGVAVSAFSDGDPSCAVRGPQVARAAADALETLGIPAYTGGPASDNTANPVVAMVEILVSGFPGGSGDCVTVFEVCHAGFQTMTNPVEYFDSGKRVIRNFFAEAGAQEPFSRRWKSCVQRAVYSTSARRATASAADTARATMRSYADQVLRTENALSSRFGGTYAAWRKQHRAMARRQFGS